MYTIAETEIFKADAASLWSDEEREAFFEWLAKNPEAGDVVPGTGGCRKVRWKRPGTGKSGGVRVIHYNCLPDGKIWLLVIYAKSVRGNIPPHILKQIKEALDGA
ncbi:transcriptional regulator [Gammaproteobacteria bacterium MFB021]|nr:transcriptional regulator [Gammaproteobacteria bacterium MFB021]